MPTRPTHTHLSRRESQIMDVVYRLGEAGVAEVRRRLDDPPSYNSVRVLLGILEEKGHLTHRQEGQRYIYRPTLPAEEARRSALSHLLDTFFQGSPSKAMAALLDLSAGRLSEHELRELAETVERAAPRRKR